MPHVQHVMGILRDDQGRNDERERGRGVDPRAAELLTRGERAHTLRINAVVDPTQQRLDLIGAGLCDQQFERDLAAESRLLRRACCGPRARRNVAAPMPSRRAMSTSFSEARALTFSTASNERTSRMRSCHIALSRTSLSGRPSIAARVSA
jgi:hypothetical protein